MSFFRKNFQLQGKIIFFLLSSTWNDKIFFSRNEALSVLFTFRLFIDLLSQLIVLDKKNSVSIELFVRVIHTGGFQSGTKEGADIIYRIARR